MRPAAAFTRLILASLLAMPFAGAAHDRGEPADFPLWRGAPELTVYFPSPPRLAPAARALPSGNQLEAIATPQSPPAAATPPRRAC
jgi:hypothetical protein